MNKHLLKNKVYDSTNMPKDVVLGVPLFRFVGREELYIENYRGILEYTDTVIRVQTKIGQVYLTGCSLEIMYYTNDEMKVVGYIEKLEFCQGGV